MFELNQARLKKYTWNTRTDRKEPQNGTKNTQKGKTLRQYPENPLLCGENNEKIP